MPALRAYSEMRVKGHLASRRRFLGQLSAIGVGLLTLPALMGCSSNRPAAVTLLSDVPASRADLPLAFIYKVQQVETDVLRQALNKAAGKALGAGLGRDRGAYTLKLPPGTLSAPEADVGFRNLVTFTFAAAAHRDFLVKTLQAQGVEMPQAHAAGYQLPLARQNLAALLDALFPVAELTQRAYLTAISSLEHPELIQALASIHSVKAAQVAALAMTLMADPNPRRFDRDLQSTGNLFAENDLEYRRDPEKLLQDLAPYLL